MYSCKVCDYNTDSKRNLERHNNTQKHLNALIDKNKETTGNEFSCRKCGATFKFRSSLSKHVYNRCPYDGGNNTNNINNTVNNQENLIKIVADMVKVMQTNANAAETTSKSMNILTRATRDFSTAPPLQKMPKQTKLPGRLEYDPKTDKKIITEFDADLFMKYDEDNKLDEYFGDIILNNYITQNPNERQFWEADRERQHFIIKFGDSREDSVWIKDESGKKIKEIVLSTFFADVKVMLVDYASKLANYGLKNVDKDKNLDMEKSMSQQLRFLEISNMIVTDKFFGDVLKYISPDVRFHEKFLEHYEKHEQENPDNKKKNEIIFNLISASLKGLKIMIFDNKFVERYCPQYKFIINLVIAYGDTLMCIYYKTHNEKIKAKEVKDIVYATDKLLFIKNAPYSDSVIKGVPLIVYNKELTQYEIELMTENNVKNVIHDQKNIKDYISNLLEIKNNKIKKIKN